MDIELIREYLTELIEEFRDYVIDDYLQGNLKSTECNRIKNKLNNLLEQIYNEGNKEKDYHELLGYIRGFRYMYITVREDF